MATDNNTFYLSFLDALAAVVQWFIKCSDTVIYSQIDTETRKTADVVYFVGVVILEITTNRQPHKFSYYTYMGQFLQGGKNGHLMSFFF